MDGILCGGETRWLGRIPAEPYYDQFKLFREAVPIVPVSEWREIDRRNVLGGDYILDQNGHGSCVGFSSAGAIMRARALLGDGPQRLSGTFVYAHINGGRDAGAIIGDAVKVITEKGVCLESEMPPSQIYARDIPPSAYETAKRFRALECYIANTWEEITSAVQLGFIPVFAVMVGNNFTSLDSDGIAGFSNGPGNHAVTADGMKKTSRGWVLDMPNSWGTQFGQQGRCFLTERHIMSVQQDCYVIRCATDDPQDPNKPPIARG